MGRYIDWNDAVNRYNRVSDLDGSTEVDSTYIVYAESQVEGCLASKFTTPFGVNNMTVKDLCIDMTLAKALMFKDTDKATMILDSIDDRVKKLLSGEAQMIDENGGSIGQDVQNAWSETQDYSPTFGVGDVVDFEVSSTRTIDERDARN